MADDWERFKFRYSLTMMSTAEYTTLMICFVVSAV